MFWIRGKYISLHGKPILKKGEKDMTDTEKMDDLIKKLDEFFSDPENFDEDGYASDADCDDDLDPYGTLVCDNVCVPQSKIVYIREHGGYEVVCLERDSFGWLVGGISKVVDGKRRLLTFG